MATLWLGDFRLEQLNKYQKRYADDSMDYTFIVDSNADINWLQQLSDEVLPQMSLNNIDIIIMLGFNDCVYSCVWPEAFNIQDIIKKYIEALNDLVSKFDSLRFYICSILPIEADFPFSGDAEHGLIKYDLLASKIKLFNTELKSKCTASFLDCHSYLTATSFSTRDGVRFDMDTLAKLNTFITNQLSVVSTRTSTFMATTRLTTEDAPQPPPDSDDSATTESNRAASDNFLYWLSTETSWVDPETNTEYKNVGLNACPIHQTDGVSDSSGSVLPSNVGYVYGRFMEILGYDPALPIDDTKANWWDKPTHTYPTGQDPVAGSIICWQSAADATKVLVGVVEKVNSTSDEIIVSRSYDDNKKYDPTNTAHFNVITYNKSNKVFKDGSNTFLGFIYHNLAVQITKNKDNLYTGNAYLNLNKSSNMALIEPNAQYIWQYLGSRGWSMQAVAGLLGNLQQESKLSPGVWENTVDYCENIDSNGVHTLTSAGRKWKHGYGLTQWTPATKFFKWCENGGTTGNANGTGGILPYWDIDTQLKRIEAEVAINGKAWTEGLSQWISKPKAGYDLSFKNYIKSTKDPYWLAGAFAFCYERPARSTGTAAEKDALRKERGEYANFWYNYLLTLAPLTDTVATNTTIISNNLSYDATYLSFVNDYFAVECFNLDSCSPTQACFSFIVNKGQDYTYTLDLNGTTSTSEPIEIKSSIITETVKDLLPNTEYKITFTINGTKGEQEVFTKEFKTLQAYPDSIKKITLKCEDSIRSKDSYFKLTVDKPDNLGYWGIHGTVGYDKQLIVNNKCVKTIQSTGVENIKNERFNIKQAFGYECNTGDWIQIGIRVWVIDSDGQYIYDSTKAKTSKSICLLNKPVRTYLREN